MLRPRSAGSKLRESRSKNRCEQDRRNRRLAAQLAQLLLHTGEGGPGKRDRFTRIVGQPDGQTINRWIIMSDQTVEARSFCFHKVGSLHIRRP